MPNDQVVALQAKEIAELVNDKLKNVNRGKGGRLANTSDKGEVEEVAATGGRRVDDTDTQDETLANLGSSQKKRRRERRLPTDRERLRPANRV